MPSNSIRKYFFTRNTAKENPYIAKGKFIGLPYSICEEASRRILQQLKSMKSNKTEMLDKLNALEALAFRMSELNVA